MHVALIYAMNVLRKIILNDTPENAPSDGLLSPLACAFILKVSRTEVMPLPASPGLLVLQFPVCTTGGHQTARISLPNALIWSVTQLTEGRSGSCRHKQLPDLISGVTPAALHIRQVLVRVVFEASQRYSVMVSCV